MLIIYSVICVYTQRRKKVKNNENGIEVLRSHADSARTLTQELVEQARKHQSLAPFRLAFSSVSKQRVRLIRREIGE